MQKKFEENLEKVEQIIKGFDEFKIDEEKAKTKFEEGNKLLDECVEMVTREKK